MREHQVARAAFDAWIKTLPAGVQQNCADALKVGSSITFDAWIEAWRQASHEQEVVGDGAIIGQIDARFVSGNEIPVPSILLTRQMWAELKSYVHLLDLNSRTGWMYADEVEDEYKKRTGHGYGKEPLIPQQSATPGAAITSESSPCNELLWPPELLSDTEMTRP